MSMVQIALKCYQNNGGGILIDDGWEVVIKTMEEEFSFMTDERFVLLQLFIVCVGNHDVTFFILILIIFCA